MNLKPCEHEQEALVETTKLDKIYTASGDAEMRDAYDDWASEYDRDVEAQGYVTPKRVAEALARHMPDMGQPVMDYGCGTGLSGVALAKAGFGAIDGADLSQGMLEVARGREAYREVRLVEPEQKLAEVVGGYRAIAAAGVISKGAAPPELYGQILDVMEPGALLAFSLNELSLAEPSYSQLVDQSAKAGEVSVLFEEYGPHLANYDQNSGSTVYVVERLG
jgi:predicted TPR repeat methyltransferase